MHLKRWITSIVTLPLLVLLIYKGQPLVFSLFVFVVCIFALLEYFRMVPAGDADDGQTNQGAKEDRQGLLSIFFKALSFTLSALIMWAAHKSSTGFILGLVTLNLIMAVFFSVTWIKSNRLIFDNVFKQAIGIIYLPVCLSFIVLIRNGTDGIYWTFLLLSIVFAGDISAFYIGSSMGKHKLCPAVSPGKTFEGAIGGLGANLIVGSLWKFCLLPQVSWSLGIIFFLLLGVAGQAGDLFESVIKRVANVKDSGGIMPGHGGILDRIDAVLFAAPVAYYFKEYMV